MQEIFVVLSYGLETVFVKVAHQATPRHVDTNSKDAIEVLECGHCQSNQAVNQCEHVLSIFA